MSQFLFIIIFLLILLGSHFFIYFSFISFLGIIGNLKVWLGIVLFVLPILFIVSSVIAHYYLNYLTRAIYFVAGLWLALALNLIASALIVWIVIGFSKIVDFNLNLKVLSWLGIVFSLVFVIYGIWNVYNVKIKNITVKIRDLPLEWQGKKAVQISDVHLGYIFGRNYLQFLVEKINKIDPDIVFITGDLFDAMDGALDEIVAPLNQLNSSDGVYFVTGNHESYLGVDKVFEALKKTRVKILDDDFVNVDGVQIAGLNFPGRGISESRDFAEVFESWSGFDSAKPVILLFHSPTQVADAQKLGVDLFLADIRNVGQLFPLGFVTNIVYKGFDYGLRENGDFSIYTSSGVGAWGPTVRTSKHSEIVIINFEVK